MCLVLVTIDPKLFKLTMWYSYFFLNPCHTINYFGDNFLLRTWSTFMKIVNDSEINKVIQINHAELFF